MAVKETSQAVRVEIVYHLSLNGSAVSQCIIHPKYMRGRKVPIVKAKIGPRIMSLMCDERIFELIPVKKEIRAVISGIYIMDVKGLRMMLVS